MAHVSSSPFPSQADVAKPELVTIDSCLREAEWLVRQWQANLKQKPNERLRRVFTALADGNTHVGLLAYYLWRRQTRR